jgi:ABC-type multidrug transport system ATPase subunit
MLTRFVCHTDDRLLPNLTVRETLSFVAELKLPATLTSEQKQHRVSISALLHLPTMTVSCVRKMIIFSVDWIGGQCDRRIRVASC